MADNTSQSSVKTPNMEEGSQIEPQIDIESVEPNRRADDTNGGHEAPSTSADLSKTSDSAKTPSGKKRKNWNGWTCPRNSESQPQSSGESKKRKHDGKDIPVTGKAVTGARARAPSPPRVVPSSSSSSSSSEDSDFADAEENRDSNDSSDNSSEEEEETSEVATPRLVPIVKGQSTDYTRFDPGEGSSKTFSLPTQEMIDYTSKRFTSYVSDKRLKEQITDEYPVPTGVPGLLVPKMDDYIPELFLSRKQDYGKYSDENWCKVQARLTDVMGPLSRIWTQLDAVRTGETGEVLDLFECLTLIEKAIALLGQAHVSVSHFRRQDVVGKFTRDYKKRQDVTETIQRLSWSGFGKAFRQTLL